MSETVEVQMEEEGLEDRVILRKPESGESKGAE
jgi:hypothetical protein